MTAELTTVIGQLSIKDGKWRNKAPNQVAVREPKSAEAPGAGKGDLFIVTEIQPETDKVDALERQLAQTIRDSYYLSRGSVTASLRRSLQAGNDLLFNHNQQVDARSRLVGGVVMLVMCQEDAFVAQLGPAALYAVLGDHVKRYPARSPWLDEAVDPHLDNHALALGTKKLVEPNLFHLKVHPQDMLVLADSRLASQLPLREVVHAVAAENLKTALKNLGKVASARSCSALALEVVETTATSGGPIKISKVGRISGFIHRKQGQPSSAESPDAQPAANVAVADHSPQEPVLESVAEMAAHSAATFPRSSLMAQPFRWLGVFARKSSQESVEDQPLLPDEDDIEHRGQYHFQDEYEGQPDLNDKVEEMDSLAPEPTFDSAGHRHAPGKTFSIGKVFGWVSVALLSIVALLGSTLKSALSLIWPGASSHAARQAGTQAQRHTSSVSSWKMLRNVAIAIPLLVGLIVTVSYLQKGRIRDAEYNEYVTTAKNKLEQAQAVENVASALGLMAEAEAALVQAEQIKESQPEIGEIRQEMAQIADGRGKVQRLYYLPQLRRYTDEGTNLSGLVVQGVEVYVLDTGADRIYHHRLDDQGETLLPDDETVILTSRGQIVEDVTVSDIIGITWMPAGGNRQTSDLMILNSTGLLEFNPNWGLTTSALAGGDTLALPNAVDSYFGNFYVLDPQANKLFRYRPTTDGYSAPPESYFPEDQLIDLSSAVDLAIDGSVYILYQDGRIKKFLSSQPEDFNVTGLDVPFKNPVSIFTAPNEEVQHVYVTDAGNQRIVQLNKDGSFVRQFRPRPDEAISFANLQDLFVDEIGGRIYILDSNNLYLSTIPDEADGNQPDTQ